jgi:hypothetical protein
MERKVQHMSQVEYVFTFQKHFAHFLHILHYLRHDLKHSLLNFFLYIDLGESVVDTKLFRDFCLSFQFTFSHRNLQFSSANYFPFKTFMYRTIIYI